MVAVFTRVDIILVFRLLNVCVNLLLLHYILYRNNEELNPMISTNSRYS